MFLTHIDESGDDSPAILVENATDANRAVNIPEFVNIAPDAPFTISAPVTDYYRLVDVAEDHLTRRQYDQAIVNFRQALAANPDEHVVLNSYGVALARTGKFPEAVQQYRNAISISPDFPDAHGNLGAALLSIGKLREAVDELETAVSLNPKYAEALSNLGTALAQQGRLEPAITHLKKAVELAGDDANARRNLALALLMSGQPREGLPHAERAVALTQSKDPVMLSLMGRIYAEVGRRPDAVRVTQQALALARQRNDADLVAELQEMLAAYSK
jgi:Flp pilus assembly protein TadD